MDSPRWIRKIIIQFAFNCDLAFFQIVEPRMENERLKHCENRRLRVNVNANSQQTEYFSQMRMFHSKYKLERYGGTNPTIQDIRVKLQDTMDTGTERAPQQPVADYINFDAAEFLDDFTFQESFSFYGLRVLAPELLPWSAGEGIVDRNSELPEVLRRCFPPVWNKDCIDLKTGKLALGASGSARHYGSQAYCIDHDDYKAHTRLTVQSLLRIACGGEVMVNPTHIGIAQSAADYARPQSPPKGAHLHHVDDQHSITAEGAAIWVPPSHSATVEEAQCRTVTSQTQKSSPFLRLDKTNECRKGTVCVGLICQWPETPDFNNEHKVCHALADQDPTSSSFGDVWNKRDPLVSSCQVDTMEPSGASETMSHRSAGDFRALTEGRANNGMFPSQHGHGSKIGGAMTERCERLGFSYPPRCDEASSEMKKVEADEHDISTALSTSQGNDQAIQAWLLLLDKRKDPLAALVDTIR